MLNKVKGIPVATFKMAFGFIKGVLSAVSDNVMEQGQKGTKRRLESRKIGQWLGLTGYGVTMWLIFGTVNKILADPNWLTGEQFTNFIALITVLLGGSAIFSLFYTMKKRNGGP